MLMKSTLTLLAVKIAIILYIIFKIDFIINYSRQSGKRDIKGENL